MNARLLVIGQYFGVLAALANAGAALASAGASQTRDSQQQDGSQTGDSVVITGQRIPPPPPPPPPPPAPAPVSDLPIPNSFSGVKSGMKNAEGGPGSANKTDPSAKDDSKKDCQTSHPVIITTGEKYKEEADFIAGGEYGLSLRRTYRSLQASASMFGPHWLSNLDYPKLSFSAACIPISTGYCLPTTITHTRTDGTKFDYTRSNPSDDGIYYFSVGGAAATGNLFYISSGTKRWVLQRDKKTYTYSASGNLQRITDQAGASLTFTYTGSNVSKVTNTVGQSINLTWTNGRVTQVTDPAGNPWTYTYNGHGMLSGVTSPGGANADVRAYHYESPYGTNLLTGISINGSRYSTYSYFSNKRVQVSGLQGGEERDTFKYETNKTTVTSAANQPVTYVHALVKGERKVTSISRAATSTCAAAAASTVYDANGFIDYTLDWNNNKTDYSFDAAGKLLQVTTAANTAKAATTVHAWTGEDITRTTYRDAANAAFARVDYTYHTSGQSRCRKSEHGRR